MPPVDDKVLYLELLARLEESWNGLPDKPEETPEGTLRALWFRAAGDPRSIQRCSGNVPGLTEEERTLLDGLVDARCDGVPLAYLTGLQSFLGVELISDGNAMVPRAETELLGRKALGCLGEILREQAEARVIDVCTGSGNLAVALAVKKPRARIAGVDLIPGAIELARRNAERNGVTDRVAFHQGDLFAPFEDEEFLGSVDLVVCNPPYITTAKVDALPSEIIHHEPRPAFDGGPLGLAIILRLMKDAPRFLRAGGWLCFELGLGQGGRLTKLLTRNPLYEEVEVVTDDAGSIRVLVARRSKSPIEGQENQATSEGTMAPKGESI